MKLADFLKEKGFAQCASFPMDGTWYVFDRGGTGNGRFRGTVGQGGISVTLWDWKTSEKYEWRSYEHEEISPEERERLRIQYEAEEKVRRAAKEALHERVAVECLRRWESDFDCEGESPYLARKHLPGNLYGARLRRTQEDVGTVVAARDSSGKIWTVQLISPDGQKDFAIGGRVRGCYHLIGDESKLNAPGETLYVTEGFATGASVHLATGKPTVCCFNAGNLEPVSLSFRQRYPGATIVVAGDDDRWTTRPDGTPFNPGREAAVAAAHAVGGRVSLPHFVSLDGKPTDWNDLHCREGLPSVKEQLEAPPKQATGQGAGDIEPILQNKGLPAQQRLVNHLLDHLAGRLIRQGKDIFAYTGTHWRCFTPTEYDKLKVLIQTAYGERAEYKHVNAVYQLLLCYLPNPPIDVDLFAPNPFAANFLNGTLWLVRGSDFKYSLIFKEHSRTDYLVNVLPYEYKEGCQKRNAEFDGMLERVFQGDPDVAQKRRAVAQMYGACLMPAFPRLFMLHGEPGTGKSTVINVACRLVHKDNLSSIPPNQWHGFNMAGMAGKLVNADTDIPLNEPLTDEIVKKVIERKPFTIRRKNKDDLTAPIPSVHLFGGNGIPKTLDGASGAHSRRWTFLEFRAFVPKGQHTQEYWDYCFEQGPEGVLNFAMEGLRDLIASNGHFLNPDSGVQALADWQLRTDVVGQFLRALDEGEVRDGNTQVMRVPEGQLERSLFWEIFKNWYQAEHNSVTRMGRTTFFEQLRRKKVLEHRTKKGRFILGVRSGVTEDAKH